MEAVIDGGLKLVKNSLNYRENVELLGQKVVELTCRAEDIEEKVRQEESSGKKKRKREVENWLNDFKKAKDNFIALQNKVNEEGRLKNPMSGEHVVKLLDHVATLGAQSKTHHFNELVLDANDNRGEPRLTSELIGEIFKENLEKIKQHLFNDNITSIGICGMGGVGKTTLAKHINNDLLKILDFHVCWLTVSQELNIKKLQDGIARYTNLRLCDDDDEEQRAQILFQKLKQIKKFILILDDVWNFFCLEKLGVSLDAEHRLIFTTRSLGLCHQMLCQEIIQVKTLQPHEAWDLFKATLGYQNRFDEAMEAVARKIIKKCGGLPLGIITMAGSMRGVEDLQEWRNALNQLKASSEGLEDMERYVFPILQWSFTRLNKYQQRCMLCCSLYPEDCIINREKIISRFISLDLMVKMDTKKKEYDQGHTILNHLIKSCLLEKAKFRNGPEGVKMHDLIRCMVLRLTSGNSNYSDMRVPKYVVKSRVGLKIVPEGEEWVKDLDVVSLMDNQLVLLPRDIERLLVYQCIGRGTCLEDTIRLNTTGLSSLFIYGLPEVEFLLRLPGSSSPLQVLQKLRIGDMRNLIGIVRWEDSSAAFGNISHHHHHGTFSCLREFTIRNCNKITKLFPNWLLQNLQNLEKLAVIGCAELQEIIAIESEDSTSSGTTIPATLPKLKDLYLESLPRLRSICDGTLFWDSMERILIFDCPNLKRPPHFPMATTTKNVFVSSAFKVQ